MNRKGIRRFTSNDGVLGVVVLVVVVALLGTLAIIYLRPPGQKTITFEVTDASAIETGQDIRVAGISIGKVSEVALQPDRVKVTARIDEETFVGDQTKMEVRMLTPVGGYAITMIPLGREELKSPIPAGRVTVPYSIGDVIQAVPSTTDTVDTTEVNANLDQVAGALDGNDTSLRSIVNGLESVTSVFDRQRGQVHQIAALASEYLQTFNGNREFVFELIRKIDMVVSTYHVNSAGFNYAYKLFANVLMKLAPFMRFYLNHSELVSTHVNQMKDTIIRVQQQLGPAIDGLVATRKKLAQWITPEGMRQVGGGTLWTENVCIPIPGRNC
ncbi:MlaD family protein [Gordonia sp. KTR9]|uniref:MlaD family protein n=1 Tax=Gordonia sp. KTR9 TaxID=337191 RepID=UPI00027DDD7F|nr:MlaD family protein [Gordonia sp. KTR9]AFR47226.1 ABC-type transport system involved in resistance to organic solvents, periplasmic component [Gordonia sp. KTR9]